MAFNAENLCEPCADLDIDKIFSGGYETPHLVLDLGHVPAEHLTSPCNLCRLIAEAVHRPYGNSDLMSFHDSCGMCGVAESTPPYQLFAVQVNLEKHRDAIGHSKWSQYEDAILSLDQVATGAVFSKSNQGKVNSQGGSTTPKGETVEGSFIALRVGRKGSGLVAYSGSLYPAFGDPAPARMLPQTTVDWALLRSFLRGCRKRHSACSFMKGRLSYKGLRFIDCETRQLRQAVAGDKYVALSYVWGETDKKPQDDSDFVDGKLREAPLVIEDAIEVVLRMKHRYLWVDRYCIPQGNEKVFQDHLSRMHYIYQGASFTIIAAAGTDSSFGLPGVSTRPREVQPSATVDGRLLVGAVESFLPTSNCKWNTRGWTYQEDHFSTRQLIFTSHQVSFHCLEGQQSEIFTSPAKLDAPNSLDFGDRTGSVWSHVARFSRRNLTYGYDALNALKATMNAFNSSLKEPTRHLWGIPYASTLNPLTTAKPTKGWHEPRKIVQMVESAHQVFGYGLAWAVSLDAESRRRQGFPTWSWASVAGHIDYPPLSLYGNPDGPAMDPDLSVSIEESNGQVVPVSVYLSNSNAPTDVSRYLHVNGWSVRDALTLKMSEGTAKLAIPEEKYELSGVILLDRMSDGEDTIKICDALCATVNSKKAWEAVIVWIAVEDMNDAKKPFIILLLKVDDSEHPHASVYERVGCIPALFLQKMPRNERRDAAAMMQLREKIPLMKWAADEIEEDRVAAEEEREKRERARVEEEAEAEAAWQAALKEGWDPSQEKHFRTKQRFEGHGSLCAWPFLRRSSISESEGEDENIAPVQPNKTDLPHQEATPVADVTSNIQDTHEKEAGEPETSTLDEVKVDTEEHYESDSDDDGETTDSSDEGDYMVNLIRHDFASDTAMFSIA
ncbi:hypothetical protein FDECE_12042 [Fusarium decemcellulare]|nr:hypothetical protein FDECE_12042 [Fusarium decemcellulare]